MDEREALMRAICEHPDEDTPRLAFADWLDERGEPERAEFIRVQIELATGTDPARRVVLECRARELLAAHQVVWNEPLCRPNIWNSGHTLVHEICYRRGFAFGFEALDHNDNFADYAAELFRHAPIRRVVFRQKCGHERVAACPVLLRLTELRTDADAFAAEGPGYLFGCPYLRNLTRLELIEDYDNGHLSPEGLELLSHATTTLPRLRYLDISGNWCHWHYDRLDWIPALLAGPLVSQLECLRLRRTRMDDVNAELLAGSDRLRRLTHLDLAGNRIGERGLRALAESSHLAGLAVLDLRGNHSEDAAGNIVTCPPEVGRLLAERFGDRVLLDGDPED